MDFVHLGGVGEDVGELSVNCGWGFQLSGFNPDSVIFQQASHSTKCADSATYLTFVQSPGYGVVGFAPVAP